MTARSGAASPRGSLACSLEPLWRCSSYVRCREPVLAVRRRCASGAPRRSWRSPAVAATPTVAVATAAAAAAVATAAAAATAATAAATTTTIAAAATTTAAAAAAATRTRLALHGLVHLEGAAAEFDAVHGLDRGLSVRLRCHFYEREAAATASVAIDHDVRALDLAAVLLERGDELVLHGVEGQVANEKTLTHSTTHSWTSALGHAEVAWLSMTTTGCSFQKSNPMAAQRAAREQTHTHAGTPP